MLVNNCVALKRKKYRVINKVLNNDFSQGTANWVATAGTNISASNNTLTLTGNGTAPYLDVTQVTSIPCANGKKVYIKANVKVNDSLSLYSVLGLYGSTNSALISNTIKQLTPVNGQWYIISGIATMTGTPIGNVKVEPYTSYGDNPSANGKTMNIQNVVCVDLTTLFGAGSEPSLSDCNLLFN